MERVSLKKIARAAVILLETRSPAKVMAAVAGLLAEQRRVRESELLVQEIAAELWRARRQANVTITSAHSLAQKSLAAVQQFLKARLAADDIVAETAVNPKLLGGVVAVTPIGTLDASVAGRLNQLKQL